MVPIEPNEPLEPLALRGVTGIVAGSVCDYSARSSPVVLCF